MSKKTIETLVKISNNVTTKVVKGSLENPIPGKKWRAEVEGEFKDMSSKSSFEKIVLDFIKEQKTFNNEIRTKIDNVEKDMTEVKLKIENVEHRLENVEKDINQMKNTPTMKKELK